MSLTPFAPIVLFLYNRPIHTEATLENLAAAKDACKSDLYIFCDGPKRGANQQDLENNQKVRQIAAGQRGFKSLTVKLVIPDKM